MKYTDSSIPGTLHYMQAGYKRRIPEQAQYI